jgi:hypothetical protein
VAQFTDAIPVLDCNLKQGCYFNTFGCTLEAVSQLTVNLKYRVWLPRIEDRSLITLVVLDCDQRAGLGILHETYCCGDGSGMLF